MVRRALARVLWALPEQAIFWRLLLKISRRYRVWAFVSRDNPLCLRRSQIFDYQSQNPSMPPLEIVVEVYDTRYWKEETGGLLHGGCWVLVASERTTVEELASGRPLTSFFTTRIV